MARQHTRHVALHRLLHVLYTPYALSPMANLDEETLPTNIHASYPHKAAEE